MLPAVSSNSHAEFQDQFVPLFLLYYPDPFSLARKTWEVIIQFWNLNLSLADGAMATAYSKYGPQPRRPSSMLRPYLLSLKLGVTPITRWAAMLKECPLYAILTALITHMTAFPLSLQGNRMN